ncbi:MAG: acyl-CoA thioesterase [Phycisphaeraceae bacterium]|nr:acyl-CoA thioesterase [Phycisphaeraceae bacterium]
MSTQVSTSVEIRVRYNDCDPMRVVHHSVYPVWFEIARTELLRQRAMAYREMEERGVFFVVTELSVRYRKPARYDDVIRVEVVEKYTGGVKIQHEYGVFRGQELLVEGSTTLVCVSRDGKPQRLPEFLA